jgi:hypothetical protein
LETPVVEYRLTALQVPLPTIARARRSMAAGMSTEEHCRKRTVAHNMGMVCQCRPEAVLRKTAKHFAAARGK